MNEYTVTLAFSRGIEDLDGIQDKLVQAFGQTPLVGFWDGAVRAEFTQFASSAAAAEELVRQKLRAAGLLPKNRLTLGFARARLGVCRISS